MYEFIKLLAARVHPHLPLTWIHSKSGFHGNEDLLANTSSDLIHLRSMDIPSDIRWPFFEKRQ